MSKGKVPQQQGQLPAKVGGVKKWRNPLAGLVWVYCLLSIFGGERSEGALGNFNPPANWDVKERTPVFPSWFGPVSTQAGLNLYTWRAQIRPPAGEARLAVTLVFREPSDGFARVIWQGPGQAVTLCGNLFERAAALHQRTLLLDREMLSGPGQIIVESTGSEAVLERVELVWVEPLVLMTGEGSAGACYLTSSGKVLSADELSGNGRRSPVDQGQEGFVDAVLDPGPVRIDSTSPVRFVSSIAGQPGYARLEAQVAGLDPGKEPGIFVNGKALESLSVEVPGLADPGYRKKGEGYEMHYGGWRKLVAYVPTGFLRMGENQVDFQVTDGSGMTVRNLRLQVVFPIPEKALPATPVSNPAHSPAFVRDTSVGNGSLARPQLRTGLSSGTGGVGLRTE